MRMFLMIVPPILAADYFAIAYRGASPWAIILSNMVLVPLFGAIYIYAVEPVIKKMQKRNKEEK